MRTIKVCSGIGDNIWLLMKLVNAGEKFNFILPDGQPQRGKQIFDIMPSVAESCLYSNKVTYSKTLPRIYKGRVNVYQDAKHYNIFKDIKEQSFSLSCNEHLESGKRIESFIPDLPTTFKLNYDTSNFKAPGFEHNKIGVYCSSHKSSKNWGTWTEVEWFKLVKLISEYNPDYTFVIIGAEWDVDMADKVKFLMIQNNIKFIWTVGQNLGTVVEILKQLKYFIGFPSGLSILNETLEKDGLMFYAKQIQKIINTWANPVRIANGNIKECLFCNPEEIFSWLIQNNKI